MRLKPRNINPGPKRVQVDPAIATVLTRIITREVERQVAIIQEEMNSILAAHTKRLEEMYITLQSVENGHAQTAMEVLRELSERNNEGTARPEGWGTYTTTNVPPIATYADGGTVRQVPLPRGNNYAVIPAAIAAQDDAAMEDDITEFMNLIVTDPSTT